MDARESLPEFLVVSEEDNYWCGEATARCEMTTPRRGVEPGRGVVGIVAGHGNGSTRRAFDRHFSHSLLSDGL